MYHDQGLIPFKPSFERGVNYTAGLPVVRTSPARHSLPLQERKSISRFIQAIPFLALIFTKTGKFMRKSQRPVEKYDVATNQEDESVDIESEEGRIIKEFAYV